MPGDTTRARTAPCPTCGKPVAWASRPPWRPFCSERCKLIDLGNWLDGSNRIPGDEEPWVDHERDS